MERIKSEFIRCHPRQFTQRRTPRASSFKRVNPANGLASQRNCLAIVHCQLSIANCFPISNYKSQAYPCRVLWHKLDYR